MNNKNVKQNHLVNPIVPPRIPLREVFSEERYFFSPFVADHIGELGNAIGKHFNKAQPEQKFGTKTVDVVAEAAGNVYVIESQLSLFDHTHLSRSIGYVNSLNASGGILLAPQFPKDIIENVKWLNENTHAGIEFFAVEVQAFLFGNIPVVSFHCITGPAFPLDNLSTRQIGYALQPIIYCWADDRQNVMRVGHWKDLYGKVLLSAYAAGVDLRDLSLCPDGNLGKLQRVPHPITIQTGVDTLFFEGRGTSEESKQRISDVLRKWGRHIIILLNNKKRIVLPRPEGRGYNGVRFNHKMTFNWSTKLMPKLLTGRKFYRKPDVMSQDQIIRG